MANKKYRLKKGATKKGGRNVIPLRAKFEAIQLAEGDMIAKEALAEVAETYGLDANKPSYTKHAGSTINRFREEISRKLENEDANTLELADEFQLEFIEEETAE